MHHLQTTLIGLYALLFSAFTATANPNYKPKSTPPLFADKENFQPKSFQMPEGFSLGLKSSLGQSRSTGKEGAVAASILTITAEYKSQIDHWSMWQAGFEVLNGEFGHAEAKILMKGAEMITFGYGQKVSSKIIGIWSFAGGLISSAQFTNTNAKGVKEKTDSISASIFRGAYDLYFKTQSSLILSTGFHWYHVSGTISSIKADNINTYEKRSLGLNIPGLSVGLQFLF